MAATALCLRAAALPADEPATAPLAELTENWRTTVRLPPHGRPNATYPQGECRAWVEQGWLVVERRTDQNELEWKIVLAKVVGDEPPKIDASEPGRLRLSYRDGRYFIRDEFGSIRCVRQRKQPGDAWPSATTRDLEPRNGEGESDTGKIDTFFENRWCFVAVGPVAGGADCLVRLNHRDLIENGTLSGIGVGPAVNRGESGEMSLLDDGDILIGERLENWVAMKVFARRELQKKLRGSAAPELAGAMWLNTGGEPLTWKDVKGNTVLLVFFSLGDREPRHERWGDLKHEGQQALKELHDKFYEKGLVIIGVQTRNNLKESARLVEKHHLEFPVLVNESGAEERFAVADLPSYFLIDREGKVVWSNLRTLPPTAEIEKLLEKQ